MGFTSPHFTSRQLPFFNYSIISIPSYHSSRCDLTCARRITVSRSAILPIHRHSHQDSVGLGLSSREGYRLLSLTLQECKQRLIRISSSLHMVRLLRLPRSQSWHLNQTHAVNPSRLPRSSAHSPCSCSSDCRYHDHRINRIYKNFKPSPT